MTPQDGSGVAGAAREPINAWLPLRLTAAHWRRARLVLPPAASYVATLDAMAMDAAQLAIPFVTFVAAIAQAPTRHNAAIVHSEDPPPIAPRPLA